MLKHSTTKTILLHQNGFGCEKNESSLKPVRLGLISRGTPLVIVSGFLYQLS